MYCIDVGKYVITEGNKIQCPCSAEVFFTIFETDDILHPAQDDQCVVHMTSHAQCVVREHSRSYSRGILSSAIKDFPQHRMPSLTIQASFSCWKTEFFPCWMRRDFSYHILSSLGKMLAC